MGMDWEEEEENTPFSRESIAMANGGGAGFNRMSLFSKVKLEMETEEEFNPRASRI
jgi:hypothetical protein